MIEIIPKDSRYVPLTQQNWCCVPTCIQMIMLKHEVPLLAAEFLGYHLGLIVPEQELKYFWNARTGKRPSSGWGTQIGNQKYEPNLVFEKLNIPLKMSLHLIDKFETVDDFKEYLVEIEKYDRDVLICFDWGALVGSDFHSGHVCVFDRIYSDKDELRFINPGQESKKWEMVKIDKIFEAMKYHGEKNMGGCWEFDIKEKGGK